MNTEDRLKHTTYVVEHNPNCPSPFMIRLVGNIGGVVDKLPPSKTNDLIAYGETLLVAAEHAFAKQDRIEPEDPLRVLGPVKPQKALTPKRIHNRTVELIGPAILTKEEVGEILGLFRSENLRAMKILLVDHGNEPYEEDHGVNKSSDDREKLIPLWYRTGHIESILTQASFKSGRQFRFMSQWMKGATRKNREYQLWEVREKKK